MKIVGMIAALALATAPMMASAQSSSSSSSDDEAAATPEAGGVSQEGALPIFGLGSIPAGAIIVGGVVILAGAIIGVVASQDSTVNTN